MLKCELDVGGDTRHQQACNGSMPSIQADLLCACCHARMELQADLKLMYLILVTSRASVLVICATDAVHCLQYCLRAVKFKCRHSCQCSLSDALAFDFRGKRASKGAEGYHASCQPASKAVTPLQRKQGRPHRR